MDTLLNLKSNLIQNFYVLGLSPSKFFQIGEDGKGVFLNVIKEPKIELTPEVISKFPPENGNYNSAKDDIVIAHCFPHGLKALQTHEIKLPYDCFEFHLDNILFNYNEEDKRLYSKIYFTCLTFYESLEIYNKYKNEIITFLSDKNNSSIELLKNGNNEIPIPTTSTYLKKFYIPKIICFASLMPFSKELRNILRVIYQLYCVKAKDSSVIPVEKFVEQVVLQTPLPLSINEQLNIEFKLGIDLKEKMDKKTMKQKSKSSGNLLLSNLNFMKKEKEKNDDSSKAIKFPINNINESFIKFDNTNSFEECFSFFSVDDIIRLFKYVLLEIPVLFFCPDKEYLSKFIQNLLSLLSPFNYILPNIEILPKKFYGLINSEPKFIFGINEKYNIDFFIQNNLDIDKNLVVVNINMENNSESKIEEIMKKTDTEEKNYLSLDSENEPDKINLKLSSKNSDSNVLTNDYIIYDKYKTDLINIDFPSNNKKKLATAISSILADSKKKAKKGDIDDNFNYKIQSAFYKFLVGIFYGFSDYFLKSKFFYEAMKNGNCGDNMRYKSQTANISDTNFLKDIFNLDECVKSYSRDLQPFFYVFFNTKIFLYYIRDRIYFKYKLHSLPYVQFEQYIYLKKHTELRKKYKDLYEKFKKGSYEKPKINKNIEVVIKTGFNFTEQEIKSIIDNKADILLKYAQFVHLNENDKENSIKKINYILFPKLLFDDSFFDMNYETSFFLHGIMLPSDKLYQEYKNNCLQKMEYYIKNMKQMFYPYLLEDLKKTGKIDFSIDVYEYVQFDWLILLCCSLWYCEPMEREMRLDKIFETIDKISYLEETVIIFIYINFLKYGSKTQCIKMLEKMYKFFGHSNYLFLVLLCNKLEEEIPSNNNEDKDNKNDIINNNKNNISNNEATYILKTRSIILSNENFFQKRCSMPININFSEKNSTQPKISRYMSNANKIKNTKSFHVSKNMLNSQELNHKEKIVFNQGQLCPKCNQITYFDSSEIFGLTINEVKVNFEYVCKNCGAKKNNITIKYQIILVNNKKKQSFVTKLGEFQLLSPYRLYTNLKFDQLNMKDYSLKIDNIYVEKKNELFNYIFYFCRKNLTFDFLIPYKSLNNLDLELIENNLGSIISNINKQRFSIKNQISPEKLFQEMENEFIPINISENSNYDKNIFDDLTPIYTSGVYEGIYGNGDENDNNERNSLDIAINKNSDNSFCILSK